MTLSFLNEENDQVVSEAHAKELLNVQAWYNKALQQLNDQLAKKKSDLQIKYMNIAKQQSNADKAKTQQTTKTTPEQAKQTGTVTTAGQPVGANGQPQPATVESYGILKIKKSDINEDDEVRYTGNYYADKNKPNWYQRPENKIGYEEPKPERKKRLTPKLKRRLEDIKYMIQDLNDDIKREKEKYSTPTYSGISGEIENFFGEIGPEAANILGEGTDDATKLELLKKIGVNDPEDVLETYYYYYPEFNNKLDKERKESEKRIEEYSKEIEDLENEVKKIEESYEVFESAFDVSNVDPYELQDLKDYLDAEDISYMEQDDDVLDFDETELDKEWQDKMKSMGMEEVTTDDIISVEDEPESKEDIADVDDKIDEEKVFYVKIDDEGEEFIGKIYKLFDEGDWRSKLVDGISETFEQLNYDPDWDEVDIVAFLRENYADAEIIDESEFNGHVEEPEAEPEKVKESKHSIPTFDEFLSETLKFSDGEEFDTSGKLRTEERKDGWYVIGEGKLIPVESKEEGEILIKKLK